ncbi:hypothetical protein BH09MYX1_BH09MYX1_25720 [soil metagenome]
MGISKLRLFGLPPLGELAKSSEVEDPIDRNVYRPIAYVIVGILRHTPITPNQVTLVSAILGIEDGGEWLYGSRGAMIAGGVLLLLSSIVDGVDGMLARVKKIQSQLGRAIDGSADMLVAVATVIAGVTHVFWQTHAVYYLVFILPISLLTAGHIYLYDYYKDLFLRFATTRKAEGQTLEGLAAQKAEVVATGGGWFERLVLDNYATVIRFQHLETGLTNPRVRELDAIDGSDERAVIYRKHNKGPMTLWAWISLTPHCYIMATFGLMDRLYLYFWFRLIVMNGIFVIALVWQRIATKRTLRDFAALAP